VKTEVASTAHSYQSAERDLKPTAAASVDRVDNWSQLTWGYQTGTHSMPAPMTDVLVLSELQRLFKVPFTHSSIFNNRTAVVLTAGK
jgi:hypothetical protein